METFEQLCDRAAREGDIHSLRELLKVAAFSMGDRQAEAACRAFLQAVQELSDS